MPAIDIAKEGLPEAPDTARRFLHRSELCPRLWDILEASIDADGINLMDLKTHLLLCSQCQGQAFGAAEKIIESGKLPGGTEGMFSFLLQKMRRILVGVRADALEKLSVQDRAALGDLIGGDAYLEG
jgi:hypothetical protein